MLFFKKLLAWARKPKALADEQHTKYRLMRVISFEFLIIGFVLMCVVLHLKFWIISGLLMTGIIIALGNLAPIRKNSNLILYGYITNISALIIITVTNLWLGGLSTTFLGWFYVVPVIATITIGLEGFLIYSVLSASILFLFISGYITPIHAIPTEHIKLLDTINHSSIFLLIFTTLYSLLTENKQHESQLEEQNFLLYADKQKFHYLSHHDFLTNLPNRSYFHHHLQAMMDATNTKINTITLYYMDLDGFKKINDKYGHEIGDVLLLQTGKRLQSCFREKDFIARLGGDEFTAVISYNIHDKIAGVLVKRIEHEFKKPFLIHDLNIKCTISVGKANYPKDATTAETLLKMADEAMYHNKKMYYEHSQGKYPI